MKKIIKQILRRLGDEVECVGTPEAPSPPNMPGAASRPIGNVQSFLEDILARGFHPRGIIDVGAHMGYWTVMAKSVFPEAKVLMIEPQEEMEEALKHICRAYKGLEYIKAGAGREKGHLVQSIMDDPAGSSFLPKVDNEEMEQGQQRLTDIVTIDDLLKERNDFSPDLVKLDVQGFELEALKGAESLFGNTELFILETSLFRYMDGMPTTAECFSFMLERGYEFYDVTEYLRRPFDGALGQIDLAFAKRIGLLRQCAKWDAEH